MKSFVFNIFDPKNKAYLDILDQWYKARDWQPLPATQTGIMVFDEDKPICAGWLYKTDSAICLISNIISNQYTSRNKKEAIKFLLESLELEGKKQGFNIMLLFMTVRSITNIAKQNGYIQTGKADELIKNLA